MCMCITYILTPLNIYMFLYQYRTREGKEGERETGGGEREKGRERVWEERKREESAREGGQEREGGRTRRDGERKRERERERAPCERETSCPYLRAWGKKKKNEPSNNVLGHILICLAFVRHACLRKKRRPTKRNRNKKSAHIPIRLAFFLFFATPAPWWKEKKGTKGVVYYQVAVRSKKMSQSTKKTTKIMGQSHISGWLKIWSYLKYELTNEMSKRKKDIPDQSHILPGHSPGWLKCCSVSGPDGARAHCECV